VWDFGGVGRQETDDPRTTGGRADALLDVERGG
jgi:hypothetical protein